MDLLNIFQVKSSLKVLKFRIWSAVNGATPCFCVEDLGKNSLIIIWNLTLPHPWQYQFGSLLFDSIIPDSTHGH